AGIDVAGHVSGGKKLVENGDLDPLSLDEVDAFGRQGEVRVVGSGDVSLLGQVPGGEVEIVAWEPHALFDLGEAYLRVEGVGAALVVEHSKNRETPIELALHLVHEVNRLRERGADGALLLIVAIVFRSAVRIGEHVVGGFEQEEA